MLRLRIEIDFLSPFLRVFSGVLYAEEVDTSNYSNPAKLLFKCKVKKKEGTLGYSAFEEGEGIPSKLFKCMRPVVDRMLHSYWNGMVLEKEDYAWIPMSGDESWKDMMRLRTEIGAYIKKEKL